jgi:uncharacterized protein with HEPN domain
MARDAVALLWDVRAAADAIGRFLYDKTFDDFIADEMLSSAVERQFEIVGEALT